MRLSGRAFLAIAVLWVASVRAQSDSDAFEALNKGRVLFESGAFQPAREEFARANQLAPSSPNPYRWLGLTDAKLGRCADALWAFDTFLKLVKPDDKRIPEVNAARDQCKEALRPKTGTLRVETTPADAEVRLDDPRSAASGNTPFHSEAVSPGDHVVHVSKPGFALASRKVNVVAERETTVTLSLESLAKVAELATVAAGPELSILTAPKAKKRYWIAGVVVGIVAVSAIGIGIGVGLSNPVPSPTLGTIGLIPK